MLGQAVPHAKAGPVFSLLAGSSSGGNPVDASATFTFGSGTVQVVITDNEVNPKSDGQTINGISFSLSSGQTAGWISNSSGQLIDINGDGSFSTVSGNPSWHYNQANLGVEITSIGNPGARNTIIGNDDGTGNYSDGNGSITNGAHNPFVQHTATFDLSIPGVSSTTTINSMQFEFGTSAGANVTGQLVTSSVPEPSSLVLSTFAVLGALAWHCLRRRQRALFPPTIS
jgi:hypothetical protein